MATAGVVGDINRPNTVEYYVALYGNYQAFGHAGEDIACPIGTPVYAMASGTVLWADWGTNLPGDESDWGYRQRWYLYKGFPGIVTLIQHPWGIGVYAHLSDNDAAPTGTVVREGQLIGHSGNTGGVAPHLHVEALVDLNYTTSGDKIYGRVNPARYYGGISPQGTITESQEDELSAEFERDVRAQLSKDEAAFTKLDRDLRAQLQGLPSLDRDVRADLAQKGQQIAALTSTTQALAGLVGREQGLSVDDIKQAVTEAVAAGLTITVKAGE